MRKLTLALAIGLLISAGGLGGAVAGVAAADSHAKVVIVVGATGSQTAGYRSSADSAAATFSKYTSNIVKVYSPNATWAAVQAATQGASVLVYIGHGSGYPNPYVGYLQPNLDNGMGLNASAAGSDSNTAYYGENFMAQLGLAANAVVLLWHLCYASGDNEWGTGTPTLAVAQTRVDGYASGFLRGNARAVISDGVGNISPYIDALFTSHETIDQLWKTAPNFHNHVTGWGSTRNAGYTSQIDPDLDHPASDGDMYYRSMVSWPGLTTDLVGVVAPYVGASYHAISAARVLDSRDGYWIGLAGAFSSHVARTFQVAGRGGVPTNAIAVTGNLTVTGQTAAGFLYIGPTATNDPTSSTLNFPVGDDRANGVTVALGAGGTLSATYAASTTGPTAQVIFDATGYFTSDTTGSTYHTVAGTRVLDSRDGYWIGLAGAFSSHVARTFQVRGVGGVPANAVAVTGNLTVTAQTAAGFLYVGPTATNDPTSSTLNFPVGDDRANGVTVALSASGTLSATYASASTGPTAQVIFDVTGYFTPDMRGATYVPIAPKRILDSRDGYWIGLAGAFTSHVARTFGVVGGASGVPSNANAVTGNLTVTGQTALGFLYLGPTAANNPTVSTLNFPVGDDRANGVTVALSGSGNLSATYAATNSGSTAQVIFDVTGYFVP